MKAGQITAKLRDAVPVCLIERRKQGQGRPDIIYVKNFSTAADIPKPNTDEETPKSAPDKKIQTSEKPKSEPSQTSEKPNLRNRENRSLDIGKSEPSNTESIKPNSSKTNPSFFQEGALEGAKDGKSGHEGEKQSSFALSDIERIKTEISERVFLHSFLEERDKDGEAVYNPGLVRAVFAVIIELLVHTGADIYIDGSTLNAEFVKQQIRAITPGAFEYVLKGLQSNTNAVRNMKAYMRTAVYRAVHLNEVHSAVAPNTKTSYDLNDIDRICYLDLQNLTKQKG